MKKKFLILLIGLSLTAASCDPTGLFDVGGGTRGIFKSEDGGQTYNPSNKISAKGSLDRLSVNSLVSDPANPDILYAAGGSGLYKSEDAAVTWKYILSGIAVADIAVDPFNSRTVYAAGIVGKNGKIIKTSDGGNSWIDTYSEPSQNNTVLSVAVLPSSSSTVLAGLNNGEIIRSIDAGRTWQTTKDFGARVVAIRFGSSNTAYALTSRNGLYKSTDLGITWTQSTSSLTTDTLSSPNGLASVSVFYDLALDKRQAGVIYLATEEGLFRSVDDGATWGPIALPVKNAALRVSSVAVDPTNSNTLIATVASTIYKSVNGGLTWETKVLPTSANIDSIIINPNSTNIIYLGLKG